MSVESVSLVSVIGMMDKLDDTVNFCGESKMFQPQDAFSFYSNTDDLQPVKLSNHYKQTLDKMLKSAKDTGKLYDDVEDVDMGKLDIFEFADSFSEKIDTFLLRKEKLQKELDDKAITKDKISHFVGIDINFSEITACKFVKIRLGRLPIESREKLKEYEDNPYVLFFVGTSDEEYDWGAYIVPIDRAKEVDMIFSSLYFERIRVYGVETTAEEKIVSLESEIKSLQDKISNIDKEIDKYWCDNKEKASEVFSKIKKLYTYSEIKKYVAVHNQSFLLIGWIPEKEKKSFEKGLTKLGGVECNFDKPEEVKNHTPPTKMKNRKLFRPFEFFVDMYGVPAYKEIDPTILVTITYVLLFGIMFGDFGNGLVLAIVGFLMWKFKKMALGPILIPCGISSMIFGVLFGSCFGYEDAFDAFYYNVFHLDKKPISVMEPETTNMIIYSAVAVGFVLVAIAMILNIYSSFKRGKLGRAIFGENGICGLVFYVSLIGGVVCQLLLSINIMNIAYIIGLIVIPIILVMFEPVLGGLVEKDPNAKPEKWGDFIVQRFFEILEVLLSYATNTISFLRVGAYVLVHAGMLLVVFTLAEMTSGIGYYIIVVIGNAFVIALEGLLVGIQVLRLEFYEMFSRFYDGDGEPFSPVTVPSCEELLNQS